MIDAWPPQDALVTISAELHGNGGAPYNLLKDLAKLGAAFPLEAVGLIGDDELGRWVRSDCARHGILTHQLRTIAGAATSYTDVMTVSETGRRTFFHHRGVNAILAPEQFDFTLTRAKVFHLGYLLLLDALDANGTGGQPRSSEVLQAAHQAGLVTSVDLVSETADRFAQVVLPVLPHVDYLFVNEYEASHVTGVTVRQSSHINPQAIEEAARALVNSGVRQWVVIHFPEGAFACSHDGTELWQQSLRIPAEQIKGAAGAGDAFAAGVLWGVHEDWSMQQGLLLGAATAAASLLHPTCSEGIRPVAECLLLASSAGFLPLPSKTDGR
ncbi:MAG: carbohydrate kinase family protein [Verrucomicrobiota bacterium]